MIEKQQSLTVLLYSAGFVIIDMIQAGTTASGQGNDSTP